MMNLFYLPSQSSSTIKLLFFTALLFLTPLASVRAQEKNSVDDFSTRPIYVTARIFQMKANSAGNLDLNDQVFKISTAGLSEDEKWINTFGKTYPGFDIGLMSIESRKVFRTSKPAVISMVKQPDSRSIEIILNGAQSPGDGNIPGTTLIADIGLHFGNDLARPPVTYTIRPLEVEHGMTYFFALRELKLSQTDYVQFVRPNLTPEYLGGKDIYLLCAFSVELDTTVEPKRFVDERKSLELQKSAIRQIQPEIPSEIVQAGISGFVRVRVVIAPTGKITTAGIHFSSLPEINPHVLDAARQWEFPHSLFNEDKTPITAFLAFSISAKSGKTE